MGIVLVMGAVVKNMLLIYVPLALHRSKIGEVLWIQVTVSTRGCGH